MDTENGLTAVGVCGCGLGEKKKDLWTQDSKTGPLN